MSETQVPGMGEWKKAQMETSPDFHLDTKIDDVERLVNQIGLDDALVQITEKFEQNPDDQEARRQATLILKIHDDRVKKLRDRLQH
jgi:hypothetical protein